MKISRRLIHAGTALALFTVPGVEAQGQEQVASAKAVQEKQPAEPSTLVLPARVRLGMTDGSRLTGELLRVEEGRFIVRARIPEARSIAFTEVKRAELSRGSHGHAGDGFLIAGGIGFIGGFLIGNACFDEGCSDSSMGDRFTTGAVVGVIFGVLGAGIGAIIQTERWGDLPVSSLGPASAPVKADNELAAASPDRQVRFAIGPTLDRGVQARFSISRR